MSLLLLLSLVIHQADTTVVVQGLMVRAPPASGGSWMIALPKPFAFRDQAIAELALTGNSSRWDGFDGRYVEARGLLTTAPAPGSRGQLQIRSIREVDPPGTARKTVSSSWSHRVAIVLWVLPLKFAWRTESGKATGVGPVIVYTLNNHSEADVNMVLASRDLVCFSVEPRDGGAPAWHQEHALDQPRDRQSVALPRFLREVARIPEAAAPTPGRYIVRAGLCGYKEYEVETEIEISG